MQQMLPREIFILLIRIPFQRTGFPISIPTESEPTNKTKIPTRPNWENYLETIKESIAVKTKQIPIGFVCSFVVKCVPWNKFPLKLCNMFEWILWERMKPDNRNLKDERKEKQPVSLQSDLLQIRTRRM